MNPSPASFAAVLFLSATLSLALTPAVRLMAERFGVLDQPGARKVHRRATPRLGGLAVVVSAIIGLTAMMAFVTRPWLDTGRAISPIIGGAALVFTAGLWDDLRGSSPAVKLLFEAGGALVVIASGVTIDRVTLGGQTSDLGIASIPVTLLWIVIVTNAFNLIDGLDGLAAGLAIIAAATCAAILVARGHHAEALLLVALLGALAGFLPYNFHPASIFLGDSGSLLIGFVLAVTAITGWQKGATALAVAVPLLIFAVPIVDTLTSIVRRIARGWRPATSRLIAVRQVFSPDQEHIHHRLLATGLSHRATVLILYALSVALSGLALLTFQKP